MKTKNLTLREASASGKTIKRADWISWISADNPGILLSVEDAIATDWEIKVEPREFWVIHQIKDQRYVGAFNTPEAARAYMLFNYDDEIIHVKEVIE